MANRDWRHHDHAVTWRYRPQARFRKPAVFGVQPALMDAEGNLIEEQAASGNLVITGSWPGQIRSVYGDHQRVIDTYYSTIRAITSLAMVLEETKTVTTGLPAASTT
ncbi:MAG: hypothetical protein CM15mP120_23820 [Pseudomonadota bacterium]|nr:MAG: hypothetical protein CM15mP120_23820 [Pseudomonadota bacterium]